MLNIVKIISSSISKLNYRVFKYLRFGNKDIQTAVEINPFGIDSKPPNNYYAIVCTTSTLGKNVLLGVYSPNKEKTLDAGATRIFSTNNTGKTEQVDIHLKNDGVIEIGGTDNYLVKFNELKDAFDSFKQDFNRFVDKYNTHTHTAPSGATGPPLILGFKTGANIDPAKNEQIKTR